jgi:hypothetical protein
VKLSARKKARRWVVERTHSWLTRFRRLLVRWEKRENTHLPGEEGCTASPPARRTALPAPGGVRAILEHLALPTRPAQLAPAQGPPQQAWC